MVALSPDPRRGGSVGGQPADLFLPLVRALVPALLFVAIAAGPESRKPAARADVVHAVAPVVAGKAAACEPVVFEPDRQAAVFCRMARSWAGNTTAMQFTAQKSRYGCQR